MSPRIKEAKINSDYTINLTFLNNEVGVFDLKPYLNKGKFRELLDYNNLFNFYLDDGVITWYNGLDLSPDTVYMLKQ